MIDEGIRQLCMWNSDRNLFWSYIYHYDKFCLDSTHDYTELDLEACHHQALSASADRLAIDKTFISKSIESCYNDSFDDIANKSRSHVKIVQDQIQDASGLIHNFEILPALLIEDYLVRGSMNTVSMASSICDSMTKPPALICDNLTDIVDRLNSADLDPTADASKDGYQGDTSSSDQQDTWQSILLTFIVLLLGSAVLLLAGALLAKKLLEKHMNRYLNAEVDINVQDYVRMRSEESTNVNVKSQSIV